MSNWFVIFVQTGKEHAACKYLNEMLNEKDCIAFVPQIELIYKNSKQIRKELRPMFPGYVFTETLIDARNFTSRALPIVRRSKHIIKLLGEKNTDYMSLYENEKEFLLGFCDDQYKVGMSLGFIEGDKVFVTSGPLRGKESVIKRIDRHKRRAEIEAEFLGEIRRVSLSLEIVKKI